MNDRKQMAPNPPMGWNSYDRFGIMINEAEAKAQADAMARLLLPRGWNYFVIDGGWYRPSRAPEEPAAGENAASVDSWGRCIPDEKRFPSSAGGAGLRPLADYVHERGLKFGLHVMRGIPRLAARDKLPVLKTNRNADELADRQSVCPWSKTMWGLDWSQPEAQAYYDSIFSLYAGWGVDFVKMDDVVGYAPQPGAPAPYHERDVEAARAAADASGREMVLSLSPGDFATAGMAAHMKRYAQTARVSADFWDVWKNLKRQFDLLPAWTEHIGDGFWPDCDMLPIGMIGMRKDGTREPDRPSRFTRDEQQMMMTLWAICRSPLFFGGDIALLDEPTLALLTNAEVLAVNQHSRGNRQLFRRGEQVAWIAERPQGTGKYVALFNLADEGTAGIALTSDELGLSGPAKARDLWTGHDLGVSDALRLAVPAHGARLVGIGPLLQGPSQSSRSGRKQSRKGVV